MRHCYFDESIQDRGGFVIGAYVFGPDAEAPVADALSRLGLRPGIDEFKSSAKMSTHPEQVKLRDELRVVLTRYKVGVLVAPRQDRPSLGALSLQGLDQIARANGLIADPGFKAYFDKGIFSSQQEAARMCTDLGLDQYCSVVPEQDSRVVMGLQIADLVAHTAGLMLLDSLGLLNKVVKLGADWGYDEETEIDLGFEMWAYLRWQFFSSGPVPEQDEIYAGALTQVGRNGLFISPSCSTELREAAESRFGQTYRGCTR